MLVDVGALVLELVDIAAVKTGAAARPSLVHFHAIDLRYYRPPETPTSPAEGNLMPSIKTIVTVAVIAAATYVGIEHFKAKTGR